MIPFPAERPRHDPFDHAVPLSGEAIKRAFHDAGYSLESLSQKARVSRPKSAWDMKLADLRTREEPGLNALMNLFLFGRPVGQKLAVEFLGAPLCRDLAAKGVLLDGGAGRVRAACTLLCYEDLVIAHDMSEVYTGKDLPQDHVIAVGDATMLLAYMTPRVKIGRALDVGTGSGFQALLASRYAGEVVGTDICPRALSFARLCVDINGIDNINLRQGSYFEPVDGERFGLVATNPPFVLSPESQYTYRDAGQEARNLYARLASCSLDHLDPGGFAVLLGNWDHPPGDWQGPVKRWLSDLPCDAQVFRFATQSPLEYASAWLTEHAGRDVAEASRRLADWLRFFEEKGIEQITWASLILRKRDQPGWIRCHTASQDWTTGPRGEQVLRLFKNVTAIEEGSDLLDLPIGLSPEHLLVQGLEGRKGDDLQSGWHLVNARLHLTSGFGFTSDIDPRLAPVLAACDGRTPLREKVKEFSHRLETPFEAVAGAVVEGIRPLLEGGFLEVRT